MKYCGSTGERRDVRKFMDALLRLYISFSFIFPFCKPYNIQKTENRAGRKF